MKIRQGFSALLLAFAALGAHAQPVTALHYESEPGDFVGEGLTRTFQAPGDVFEIVKLSDGAIFVFVNSAVPPNQFTLRISAGRDAPLVATGVFEGATDTGRATPGLVFSAEGRGCNRSIGRFVVLELVQTATEVTSLAVNFQGRCEEAAGALPPMLHGELRINSSIPFTHQKPAGSTAPDPFAFRPRVMATPSAAYVSNEILVNGTNASSAISVTGGQYSIDGGAFTALPGFVQNHQRVRVRGTASGSQGMATSAVLAIGGVSASFDVTTYQLGAPGTGFFFSSTPGDFVGDGMTVFESGLDTLFTRFQQNPELVLALDFQHSDQGLLTLATRESLAPPVGVYEDAVRASVNGGGPGLDFAYASSGCNELSGRFVVMDADYAPDGTVNRLAANFEQYCENTAFPLYGEIRVNSTVPFTFMRPPGHALPDPFALVAQSPVRAGATVTSAVTTVYGTNAASPIAITGGEYSVNGGAFTSAPGTVQPRDRVAVRVAASPRDGELRQATLDIGGRTATMSVETYRPGMSLSGISFNAGPVFGFAPGAERLLLAPPGEAFASGPATQVRIEIEGVRGLNSRATFFAPPGDFALRPGVYTSIGDSNPQPGKLGLVLTHYFTQCDTSSSLPGQVVIHEIAFAGGVLARFAADIDQVCDNSGLNRRVEIRYHSVVSFSALAQPVPGSTDLGADGKSDLLFQNTDGRIAAWTMDGTATLATSNLIGAGAGWSVTHLADLDGDRKADIFFQHSDGRVYVYRMDGLTVIGGKELLPAALGWIVSHVADLNGDGKADLILRNADGRAHLWLMDGTNIIGSASLLPASSGWTVVGTGDLNGDGKADIVFAHTDGRGYVYLMDGTVITGSAGFLGQGSGWVVSHVVDVDGDGKSDLLFRHVDGSAYLFLMNGTTFGAGVSVLGGGTGWTVALVGDLNGDGKADLVFRHADGRAHARLMNGTATLNAGDILPAASGWSVTQLLDFNGDGKKDLVFRNDNGSITVRLMDGLTTVGSANLIGPGGWAVAPSP